MQNTNYHEVLYKMSTNNLQPVPQFSRYDELELFSLARKLRQSSLAMMLAMSRGMVDQYFETPDPLNGTFRDILGLHADSVTDSFSELINKKVILKKTRHSVVLNPGIVNKHQELPGHLQEIIVRPHHTQGN